MKKHSTLDDKYNKKRCMPKDCLIATKNDPRYDFIKNIIKSNLFCKLNSAYDVFKMFVL